MNVKLINPFVESFNHVMGQLGFSDIKTGDLSVKGREIICSGVILVVGIVGDIKGNIVYVMGIEEAKQVASTMMMGMPVTELDAISTSSLSELSNMLSANAATNFSKVGYIVDISTPTFIQGDDIKIAMGSDKVLCVQMHASGIPMDVNISFEQK